LPAPGEQQRDLGGVGDDPGGRVGHGVREIEHPLGAGRPEQRVPCVREDVELDQDQVARDEQASAGEREHQGSLAHGRAGWVVRDGLDVAVVDPLAEPSDVESLRSVGGLVVESVAVAADAALARVVFGQALGAAAEAPEFRGA